MSPGFGFGYGFWRNPSRGSGGVVLAPVIIYDDALSQFEITENPGSARQWYDATADSPISGQTGTTLAYADLPAGVWLVYVIADGHTSNLAAKDPPAPAVQYSIDFASYADGTYLMGTNWDGTAANPGNNTGFIWYGYQAGKPGDGNNLTVVSGLQSAQLALVAAAHCALTWARPCGNSSIMSLKAYGWVSGATIASRRRPSISTMAASATC